MSEAPVGPGDRAAAAEASLEELRREVNSAMPARIAAIQGQLQPLLLRPIDPFEVGWNPVQALGIEDEPSWTQWLSALLSIQSVEGAPASALAWRALCGAIAAAADREPPVGDLALAQAGDWRQAAGAEVQLESEAPGRRTAIDLLAETPRLVAGIELKLWSPWSDSDAGRQADRNRGLVERRRALSGRPLAGHVLLTAWEDLRRETAAVPGDYPKDYLCITWRALALSLRREARRSWSADGASPGLAAVIPIVATIGAIESCILRLRPPVEAPLMRALQTHVDVLEYLEALDG